jgi:hypothetical protein
MFLNIYFYLFFRKGGSITIYSFCDDIAMTTENVVFPRPCMGYTYALKHVHKYIYRSHKSNTSLRGNIEQCMSIACNIAQIHW